MRTESRRRSAPAMNSAAEVSLLPLAQGQPPLNLARVASPRRHRLSNSRDMTMATAAGSMSPLHELCRSRSKESEERDLTSLADAVALRVCSEISTTIRVSLAEQAQYLVKALQPLSSELSGAAQKLTMVAQNSKLNTAALEACGSSDSSLSYKENDRSPRSWRSPRKHKARRPKTRAHRKRAVSAPPSLLVTQKSNPSDAIDSPKQSALFSDLPDMMWRSEDANAPNQDCMRSGELGRRVCSHASKNNMKAENESKSGPVVTLGQSRSGDGCMDIEDHSEMSSMQSKQGRQHPKMRSAGLLGASEGPRRESTLQHLPHMIGLRSLQDSLASELFKASHLVPSPASSDASMKATRPSFKSIPTKPLSPIGTLGLAQIISANTNLQNSSSRSASKTESSSSEKGSETTQDAVADVVCGPRSNFSAPEQTTFSSLLSAVGEYDHVSAMHDTGTDEENKTEKEHEDRQQRKTSIVSIDSSSFTAKTAKEVRQLNQKELTKSIGRRSLLSEGAWSSESSTGSNRYLSENLSAPPRDCASNKLPLGSMISAALLRVCGVLPWSERLIWFSALYFWSLVLLALLGTAICVHQVFETSCNHSMSCLHRLSDTTFSVGALCVLLLCRAFQREFNDCTALIVSYAEMRGFLRHWAEMSRRDTMLSLMVWVFIVLERAWIMRRQDDSYDDSSAKWISILHICTFAFANGLLMMFVHFVLYVARCLSIMVDAFCCQFVAFPDFTDAVAEWNVLQAVIRKSCETIQCCFFTLQVTTSVAALLNVVDITRQRSYDAVFFLEMLPWVLIVFVVVRMCFCAGGVTDKCARVPSLVNSLNLGTDLDRDRLYVVEYIAHSQAGFYIFEVRLTSATVLKIFYLNCVVALALATRVASDY